MTVEITADSPTFILFPLSSCFHHHDINVVVAAYYYYITLRVVLN